MHYFASAAAALVLSTALPAIALATASAPEVPSGVAAKARGDGWWFVDAKGLVLYTFERDERTPGKSSCNADCAEAWPPLIAPADAKAVRDWSAIKREDGSLQWAFKGRPLYGYAAEGGPGTTYGDGDGDLWHVAYDPFWIPSELIIANTPLGRVLADAHGMTVYTFDRDKGGKSACSELCLNDWAPVEAPFAASDHESWSTITRDDGSKQWAYQGKPLYRYIREAVASEAAGDGVAKMWHAAVLQPGPSQYPAWVTVQGSDAGPLLADRRGKTIYTFNIYRKFGKPRMCGDDPCITSEWKPVLADAEAKAQDNWTILANKDGSRQWAYHGMRLFTNDLDERPGDFWGIRFGGDRWWQTIMRSGLPMQGVDVGGGVGGQGNGR